jgi:hypothetical protein
MKTITRAKYVEILNEIGAPEHEKGRIPERAKYGAWLRRNDPIAFEVGFNEYQREG